ncbi:MAG: hypothetical protein KJT01_15395 [Gemmatimonadetes bacterium]|nr:hypothetical protein [Gemmatimonadota bacterium]
MRITHSTLPLVAALLAAAACADEPMAPAVPADLGASLNSGTVAAVIEQGELLPEGKVRYRVRVLAKKGEVASYQGLLSFEPGAVAIESITAPEAADGEVHLVNREQLAEGKIRFAGYAPEELGTSEAFSFVVASRGAGLPELAVSLDVAGTPDGVTKPASQLRGAREIRDRNGNVLR